MNKAILFFIPLYLLTGSFLAGQDIFKGLEPLADLDPSERLSLAVSNEKYSVTPGDIYQLTYQPAEEIMTILIPVDPDYSLNLGIFGIISGYGLTFPQLKQIIEKKFSSAYPRSAPLLSIYSISMFQILVTGEVPQTRYISAWGLCRLGEILKGNTGEYSSIRIVKIKNSKGEINTYDLFKGIILGDTSHNPYVKAGDTIIVSRREKQISLKGELYRPGTYEILKTDKFSDIIEIYGGNFTEKADISFLRVERAFDNTLVLLKYDETAGKTADTILKDGDTINVGPVFTGMPLVFIEGAIQDRHSEGESPYKDPGAYTHHLIVQPFFTGDTLYDVMNKIKDSIMNDADLINCYLLKGTDNGIIPVNLQALLYHHDLSHNHTMVNFDRIIIPRKTMVVMINGDVRNPGNYSFVPNQQYTYYLGLAGGVVNGRIEENTTYIVDRDGNQKKLSESIGIGDTIIIKRAMIIVAGAVAAPGEFPYVPGKLYSYYINLAGGINYDRNDGSIIITDKENDKKGKKEHIEPGDIIFIPSSGFSYNFNKYMSIIATTLSIVVSSILIWNQLDPAGN
ncbi:MAG: SLBB domain-containing protein [Spirochaetales bacterium]|nr:SLBB domain-containing protein [Spirochaetales bacterium]